MENPFDVLRQKHLDEAEANRKKAILGKKEQDRQNALKEIRIFYTLKYDSMVTDLLKMLRYVYFSSSSVEIHNLESKTYCPAKQNASPVWTIGKYKNKWNDSMLNTTWGSEIDVELFFTNNIAQNFMCRRPIINSSPNDVKQAACGLSQEELIIGLKSLFK